MRQWLRVVAAIALLCCAAHAWVSPRPATFPSCRTTAPALRFARPKKDAATPAAAAAPALPDALLKAAEEVRAKISQEEKALHLMTLGQRLRRQMLPPNRAALERVPGCTSIVWVHASETESGVAVYGEADSQVAQGLLALLHVGLAKSPAAEVRGLSANAITQACQLEDVISSARITGFGNILKLIQQQLEKPKRESEVAPALLDIPALARPSKPVIPVS